MGICTEYQELQEMAQEMSRDRWLIASALQQLAEALDSGQWSMVQQALHYTATEPLEALADFISAELQERDLQAKDSAQLKLIEPF